MVQKYHEINVLPTAILYKDGKQVKKVDGMAPEGMKELGQLLG